ncbi:MAG TPA: hypothetical protein QF564_14345 [Pirellulaceae bacterium]|nr:hypothetical protein [Pirellulaceae bacterium]
MNAYHRTIRRAATAGALGMVFVAIAIIASPRLRAGETLYNGIVLPDEWPPNMKTFPSEDPIPPYLKQPPSVIPIDVGRQLFFDDFLIESTDMTRTHHRPMYHPANPIFKPDRDHEKEGYGPFAAPFGGGVWFDPSDQLFKMWYMGGYTQHLCLATSTDGIHWTRPELDVVKGTNIVLRRGAPESNSLLMDLNEPNPAKRFKYVYFQPGGDPAWAMTYRHSPDGVHWSEPQWRSGQCGDRTSVFFNPFRKKYVFLIRATANRSGRAKRYWETSDLNDAASVKWPGEGAATSLAPLWVRSALGGDFTRPEISDMPQLYQLDAMAYESVVVGLFAIHRGRFALSSDGRPVEPGRPKCNELMVGYSRDGFHWHRPEYDTFLGVSETRGSWRWGNIQPVGSLGLVVGDHIYFYVSARQGDPELTNATEWIHDANAATGLAVMRRDGFASMDAGDETRTLTTRPVRFTGRQLFVNVDAPEGELRVEVLDRDGNSVDPFTRQNFLPIRADATLQQVTWSGGENLSSLAGKEVRFRFHLTNGSLYAFWVSPTEAGASHGYVLGGGPGFTSHADTVGRAAYARNRPPFARAGADQTVRDTDGDGRESVTLNGRTSASSGSDVNSYTWLIEEKRVATGQKAEVNLPVGTHTVTLAAKDIRGDSGFDDVVITVKPETDPVIPDKTLVMWLKADAITDVADGGPVSKWNDASPNQLFSAQSEPDLQPVWVKSAIGGQPALRFDGEDDSLMVDYCRGLLYTYYNSTLFAVVRSETGGAIISHGHTNMSVSSHNNGSLSYSSAYETFPSGEHVWPGVLSTKPGAVPLGQPAVLAMRHTGPDAGGTALFVNGLRDDNRTAIGYHPMNATNGFIGAGYQGKRNFWQGDIAEIILYGRALSDAEQNAVQTYLAQKYSIELKAKEQP